MPVFLAPLHESNDCHNPEGPGGGQFCSTEGYAEGQHEFCHGACWAFAAAVHEKTGWPIKALIDPEEGPVHAVVERPDSSLLDASGVITLPRLRRRYGLSKEARLHTYTLENVDTVYGLDEDEVQQAAEFWDEMRRRKKL